MEGRREGGREGGIEGGMGGGRWSCNRPLDVAKHLSVAEDLSEVNVEHVSSALHHDVVVVTVADAEDKGRHTVAGTRQGEVLHSLRGREGGRGGGREGRREGGEEGERGREGREGEEGRKGGREGEQRKRGREGESK